MRGYAHTVFIIRNELFILAYAVDILYSEYQNTFSNRQQQFLYHVNVGVAEIFIPRISFPFSSKEKKKNFLCGF